MKLKDLLNVNISKLTASDIKPLLNEARDRVNKQYSYWNKQEYRSPAYYGLKESGGKISLKGKSTLQQQKKELARALRFLDDPSRTRPGWEKIKIETTKKLNEVMGITDEEEMLKPADYDRMFTAFQKTKELNPNVEMLDFKYDIMQMIVEELNAGGSSADEIAVELADNFEQLVADVQAKRQASMEGISGVLNGD